MDRRMFLRLTSIAGLGTLTLPQWVRAAAGGADDRVFVLIIQRGAMDGLNYVIPAEDPEYLRIRPNIGVRTQGTNVHIPLEREFSLHPAAASLRPLWHNRELAFIVQSGSMDPTRSHFDAQDFLESGTPGVKTTDSGFLNRTLLHLQKQRTELEAVALQPDMPKVLQGPFAALAVNNLRGFNLNAPFEKTGTSQSSFEAMYAAAADQALRESGVSAFRSMGLINRLGADQDYQQTLKRFPQTAIGRRLAQIAMLIKGGTGMRVGVTDIGGWDTHVFQGSDQGRLPQALKQLTEALSAFAAELGHDWQKTVVVAATEFGRTAAENGTRGTDHGHGSVMTVAGGRVRGGRIYGEWKSLAKADLYQERDVPVTTDFRSVFTEILRDHMNVNALGPIFPGFKSAKRLGLIG